jgi:HEXXH motif-containing protein
MGAGVVPTAVGEIGGNGLVLPDEPVDEVRALARAYSRYLTACCRRFLTLEPELAPELRLSHRHIAAFVRHALPNRGRQMLSCFTSPAVGTPLQCVEFRHDSQTFQSRIDQATADMMPHLLFEMALRNLLPEGQSVLWEHRAASLASLAIGGVLVPPPAASALRISASHLTAIGADGELARLPLHGDAMQRGLAEDRCGFRFERRFRRVGKISSFATIDHNPIAEFEEHPEKAGNHIDLGGRSEDEWIAILDESFALVERFLPGEFAEMATLLHAIIPVGFDSRRHLSASYREAVGTVYLTLHPNRMTMAEAVIHEFQHNKINVAAYSTQFLSNAFHPLYKSPVRPDPRPLWGIILAVHAFLPVAELYRRMRDAGHPFAADPGFAERLSDIDLKNHEGMEMLRAHAQFTPAGRALFDDLEALERRHLTERAASGLQNEPTKIHLA